MTEQCMSFISGMAILHLVLSSVMCTNMDIGTRPFQDAVRAGTGSVMCSYQRLNNSYGCANSKTLNGLLKTELGFQVFATPYYPMQRLFAASHQLTAYGNLT